MSPEVRKAALHAAAKVAITLSLGGCGAATTTTGNANDHADPPSGPTRTVAVEADCDTYLDRLPTAELASLPPNDPLHARHDVYAPPFASVADRTAPRTQQCCQQELDHMMSGAPHRWECCSALPEGASLAGCTPWGPPMPPEMPA